MLPARNSAPAPWLYIDPPCRIRGHLFKSRPGRPVEFGESARNVAARRDFRSDSIDMKHETKITREQMVELLNEDLAREYQAIIAYTVYSQTMKGAAFTDIAGELAIHAGEE